MYIYLLALLGFAGAESTTPAVAATIASVKAGGCAFGATIQGLASHSCATVEDGAVCSDYMCGAGQEKLTPFSCKAGQGTDAACRAIIDVREVAGAILFTVEPSKHRLRPFDFSFKRSIASALGRLPEKDVIVVESQSIYDNDEDQYFVQVSWAVKTNAALAKAVKTALDSPGPFNSSFAKSMTDSGLPVNVGSIAVAASEPSAPVAVEGCDVGAPTAQIANQYTPTDADCSQSYFLTCACYRRRGLNVLAHGRTCDVACAAGYSKSDDPAVLTCKNGTFTTHLSCTASPASSTTIDLIF